MKDLVLIPVMIAMFAIGFFIVKKLDGFIDENQRRIADAKRKGRSKIRISAENSRILEAASPALGVFSAADPRIEFFLSSGSAERILEKLSADETDIVLLSGNCGEKPGGGYSSIGMELPVPGENSGGEMQVIAIWKTCAKSAIRDRVIFALGSGWH